MEPFQESRGETACAGGRRKGRKVARDKGRKRGESACTLDQHRNSQKGWKLLDSVGSLTGRRFRYNRDNQEKEHTDKPTERQRNRRNDVRVC